MEPQHACKALATRQQQASTRRFRFFPVRKDMKQPVAFIFSDAADGLEVAIPHPDLLLRRSVHQLTDTSRKHDRTKATGKVFRSWLHFGRSGRQTRALGPSASLSHVLG